MTENRRQRTGNEVGDTLSSAVRRLSSILHEAGIDNSALDARLLIAHALGLDRAQLLSQAGRIPTEAEIDRINALIDRRAQHEPVSRILGMREFRGLPFGLNEATLDPRPESETVVETVLHLFAASKQARHPGASRDPDSFSPSAGGTFVWTPACAGVEPNLRILDLGTGTGCLLLALLHELPDATGLGIDCAPRAVEQAKANAERLGLAGLAVFKVNNWADGIGERFDIIISNPPYIGHAEISALMPEVRDYDPHLALDGGEDGLSAYRMLIPLLPRLLKPNGIAVFEIGIGQAGAVRELFRKSGLANIAAHRDLGGIERCIAALHKI